MSSYLHVMLKEPEQAAILAAQAIATAAEHGFRYNGWLARMCHGWAQAQLGHPEEGASLIREALAANRANGSLIVAPAFLTVLAEAQMLAGARAWRTAWEYSYDRRFCTERRRRMSRFSGQAV